MEACIVLPFHANHIRNLVLDNGKPTIHALECVSQIEFESTYTAQTMQAHWVVIVQVK